MMQHRLHERAGQQLGAPAPTANTDDADAAHSWNTYQNRGNMQKARRDGGVRSMTVDEAIKEIEDKSTAVHTNNIGGRSSLWGQWCRRMEDSRLDADSRYIDPAHNGAVSFEEIFLRSRALEDAVASVLRFPMADETELCFLLSHCLEGDALLHQKIAEGLKGVGECFRHNHRTIPDEFVTQMLGVISRLKIQTAGHRRHDGQVLHTRNHTQAFLLACPHSCTCTCSRARLCVPTLTSVAVLGQAVHRLDEQIAFQMAKSQELTREGSVATPETKHRCSAELVRLAVEKHKLLFGTGAAPVKASGDVASPTAAEAEAEAVRVMFEELWAVIDSILAECTVTQSAAERQFESFQTKIRAAMMGDDVEYKRVIEEDQRLDKEMQALQAKRDEVQRQMDEITAQLSAVEHKKRQHQAQSHKVLATYNQRMKSFAGENQKMSLANERASAALDVCKRTQHFLKTLCESTVTALADRSQETARVTQDTTRQLLVYLLQHLESGRDTVALIQRRFNFCRVKLDSMRAELEEAKAIGLIDLAADLQSAVSKFEDMHLDATKGLESTRAEVAEVEHVLATLVPAGAVAGDADATTLRARVEELVALLRTSLNELNTRQASEAEQAQEALSSAPSDGH